MVTKQLSMPYLKFVRDNFLSIKNSEVEFYSELQGLKDRIYGKGPHAAKRLKAHKQADKDGEGEEEDAGSNSDVSDVDQN